MTRNRAKPADTSRREFLSLAVAVGGGVTLLGRSPLSGSREAAVVERRQEAGFPEGKSPEHLIRHSSLTFETRRDAFGTGPIVPADRIFVRNNLPTPDPSLVANPDAWQVAVEGVANPGTVTVRELKELGVETVATVLQCSGNGRRFFPHGASGSPWGVGAAACVLWSGVPLRAVVEARGGPAGGARFLTGTGGENLPDGVDPETVVVERSIPLDKGMEDALLAWELNGEPLPLVHGGPLRLVVPGYFGINQVKYVKRLALTPAESQANIMRTGYRVRPIGQGGDPGQPSMWEMSVKSWIHRPSEEGTVRAGRVVIEGVAFGGTRTVRRVEVSVDGGRSWSDAGFVGPDLGRYAWRTFALPTTLPRGTHALVSRATDEAGNVQPELRVENERGYGNTSWRDHAVSITAT